MFEEIKDWWENTTEREQRLSLISAVVVFIAIVYFLLWQPLANNLAVSQKKLNNAQQTLQWVEVNSNKIIAAGLLDNQAGTSQNLSQLINSTARRNKINISRIQNRNGTVDLSINQIEFNQFIEWITTLQNQHNVQTVSVDISQDKVQGMIKVSRLSLSY
ncbi:type II secretion system protein M [Psychromonas sp. SP041]|uniref:type II secretion system protein GspM n=1 Tax=Psychromonas sp. SP041 TaxID=1365007 RepID=UPI0004289601|nr:type II secretion system protein M [Psychromonas sp. SP041]